MSVPSDHAAAPTVTLADAATALGSAKTPRGSAWTPPQPADLAGLLPNLTIESLIGHGGMGAVYRARQVHLDWPVALKILAPQRSTDSAWVARFEREAKALARLDHPGIVRLYEAGTTSGHSWMLLELVDGASLRDILRTGRMSPHEALRLVEPLAQALQYAHDQGVVHRDLKPENVLIDASGRPRIVDFGLAKLSAGDTPALTCTGDVLGTAHYLAPEQLAGSPQVDHRADIYAFGVLLYELLTGELPIGRFAPPSRHQAVDGRVDQAVLRALEPDPNRRFQQVSEVSATMSGPAAPATDPPAAPRPAPLLNRLGRSRRDRWLAGVCGGLGQHTPIPSWIWRIAWILLALCWGTGVVAYLLLLLMPTTPDPPEVDDRASWRNLALTRGDRVIAGVCGGLGRLDLLPGWAWRILFLASVVLYGFGLGLYLLLWLVLPRDRLEPNIPAKPADTPLR